MSETNDNPTNDLENKVRELAKLSILSNRISETHEKNLKAYPFIFFNGVKDAKIEYDLERGHKNYVCYTLTLAEGAENPSMEKRRESIDKSIKNLFWKEVDVTVVFNNEDIQNLEKK